MKWYVGAFQKFAEFNGRARRTEYWMFMLFNFLISIALSIVEVAADMKLPILSGLYSLAVLIPALAVAVRRLHDTGRSGWWLLLAFVPILGGLVLPKAGRWSALAAMLVGVATLATTWAATGGLGWGWAPPHVIALAASALTFFVLAAF